MPRAQVLGTFDNGRIEAWLEMRPLTPEQMTAPAMALRVARRLRAFHRAPVAPEPGTGREPQLFQTILSWCARQQLEHAVLLCHTCPCDSRQCVAE